MEKALAEKMIDLAIEQLNFSYTPYSHFKVGAALLTRGGKLYGGCNIENAAYGPTICAERAAVAKAVSEGHRDLSAIAIAGRSEDYCWPCGVCRQVLYEFAPELTVLVARGDGNYVKLPLKELLPHGFGPGHLS